MTKVDRRSLDTLPQRRRREGRLRVGVSGAGYYAVCLVATILLLGPVVIVVGASFKSSKALFASPPAIFPLKPTVASYHALFSSTPFLRNVVNSVIIGVLVSAVAVCIGALAGYAIARQRFRGRSVLRISALIWYMFPPMLIMIPLYLEFDRLHLVNTDAGVGLAFLTFTIPFAIWMLTAFFQQLPAELDEAARLDGCSRFGAFLRVALPLARPALVAAFVAAFMMTWGDYLFSVTLLSSGDRLTVGAGLNSLLGSVGLAYGQLLAGTVIVLAVPVMILAVGRRWFTRGLVQGALK